MNHQAFFQPEEFQVNASEFGGGPDLGNMESAYNPGQQVDPNQLGAALPGRIEDPNQRWVGITNPANGKYVEAPLVDVGPHHTDDFYWTNAAAQFRPRVEKEYEAARREKPPKNIPTNNAGIDLTPATMDALGVASTPYNPRYYRQARMKWRFIPKPKANH